RSASGESSVASRSSASGTSAATPPSPSSWSPTRRPAIPTASPSAANGPARTTAPAPTSPLTPSAQASTSTSSWAGSTARGQPPGLLDATDRARRVFEAFPRGGRSAAFKDLLRVPLYDYQRDGALFAARAGRSLIGDEMGLGKTVQALAAAEIMARLYGVERV